MAVSLPPPIDAKPKTRSRLGRRLLLVVVGVLAIIGASFVALLIFAIRAVELSEDAGVHGQAFGATTSDVGCLRKVIAEADTGWSGYFDQDEAEFLRKCLKAASRTPDFCDDVPFPSDEDATKTWYESQNDAMGCSEELPCSSLVAAIQYHCLERRGGP